jgi:hypothetical protein
MISVTVRTVTFKYSLDKSHPKRLPMPVWLTNITLNSFIAHIKHLRNAHKTSEQESRASRVGQQPSGDITQSQSLMTTQAIIRIPGDYLGIGVNEGYHLRKYSDCLDVSIDRAYINTHGKIILLGLPLL